MKSFPGWGSERPPDASVKNTKNKKIGVKTFDCYECATLTNPRSNTTQWEQWPCNIGVIQLLATCLTALGSLPPSVLTLWCLEVLLQCLQRGGRGCFKTVGVLHYLRFLLERGASILRGGCSLCSVHLRVVLKIDWVPFHQGKVSKLPDSKRVGGGGSAGGEFVFPLQLLMCCVYSSIDY